MRNVDVSGRVTIYGLVDPRTDTLRYVGTTQERPEICRRQHLRAAGLLPHGLSKGEDAWVRSLLDAGREPELVVLEECSLRTAKQCATFWTGYLTFIGCDLLAGPSWEAGGELRPEIGETGRNGVFEVSRGRRVAA